MGYFIDGVDENWEFVALNGTYGTTTETVRGIIRNWPLSDALLRSNSRVTVGGAWAIIFWEITTASGWEDPYDFA
jgi:hypothetical protein